MVRSFGAALGGAGRPQDCREHWRRTSCKIVQRCAVRRRGSHIGRSLKMRVVAPGRRFLHRDFLRQHVRSPKPCQARSSFVFRVPARGRSFFGPALAKFGPGSCRLGLVSAKVGLGTATIIGETWAWIGELSARIGQFVPKGKSQPNLGLYRPTLA